MVIKINNKNYRTKKDVFNTINYVINPDRDDLICKGAAGFPISERIENIQTAFWKNKLYHHKTAGRTIRHMIISLSNEEMKYFDSKDLCELGYFIATEIYNDFFIVFGIHYPTDGHLHMHLIIDTVNYFTGNKLQESSYQLKQHKDMIKDFFASRLPKGYYYNNFSNICNIPETKYILSSSKDLSSFI